MIEIIKERLEIIDGNVHWKNGRNKGEKAGHENGKGYLKLRLNGKSLYVHKIAFALYNGYYPEHQVDHYDHNRMNNSELNLLKSSHLENSKNQKLRYDSPTNTLGVSFDIKRNKWKVRIGQKYLGYFTTEEEAIKVRKEAEKELDYSESHGANLRDRSNESI